MKNTMNNTITGIGDDIIFERFGTLSDNSLWITTSFSMNIGTGEVDTISKAYLKSGRTKSSLGSGTYKECYDLCIAKKLELEPKVYNWKNCFSKKGYCITYESGIIMQTSDNTNDNINVYPTKEDAAAALAHCQLLHIVNKINEDYPKTGEGEEYAIYNYPKETTLKIAFSTANSGTLKLVSEEGAEILIRDNEELLKTYFKIK